MVEHLKKINILENSYNSIIAILIGIILVESFVLIDYFVPKADISKEKNSRIPFVVCTCLGVLLYISIHVLNSAYVLKITDNDVLGANVVSRAFIGDTGRLFFDFTDIEGIYSSILSLFFKFLGNATVGLIVCDFVIDIVCSALIYFAFIMMLGRFEATYSLIVFSFLPFFWSTEITGGIIGAKKCAFALGIFVLALLKKWMSNEKLCELSVVICALIIGLLILYERINLPIIIVAIVVIFDSNIHIARKFADSVLAVFAATVVFLLGFVDVLSFNGNINELMTNIAANLADRFAFSPDLTICSSLLSNEFIFVMLLLCSVYAVTFIRNKYDNAHSVVILFILFFSEFMLLQSKSGALFSWIVATFLTVLSSIGFLKLFTVEKATEQNDNTIQIETFDVSAIEEPVKTEEMLLADDIDIDNESITPSNENASKLQENNEIIVIDEPDEIIGVELLKNPLPVPKKHEKKTMTFDYDVDESNLKYDYEIDDDKLEFDIE